MSFCEVRDGAVVERRTVRSVELLEDLLGPEAPPARVAIEACREAWHVHDLLGAWGNEAIVVDTTRTREIGIGRHGRKYDRLDAEKLARALERGSIPLAHVLSPHRRELRKTLGVRRALVETRAGYVTQIRALLRATGRALAKCDTEHFVETLTKQALPPELTLEVAPLLAVLRVVDEQIGAVDARLTELCAKEPMIERLQTAPGIGPIVAATFVSVIDEAKRFRSAHQVQSYLGLVPREDSSGGKQKLGAITKQGNAYARAMLVQAAHCVLRLRDPDDPLKRWGKAIEQRRGKRIAVVAVARKLAGVLWAMWRDGHAYDAARLGEASAHGLRTQARTVAATADKVKGSVTKARTRAAAAAKTTREVPAG